MHAEHTVDPSLGKADTYSALLPQVKSLLAGETNLVANMANLAALLHTTFGWHWVGFYMVDSPNELVLGPFQGPVACTRLPKGKGVCAAAWQQNETVVVDDVEAFPGHIACSSLSKSEIVLPVRRANGEVIAVLDIDSSKLADFDADDRRGLEAIVAILEEVL